MLEDTGIAEDTADVSCLPDVVPVCDEAACASAQLRQRAMIFAVDLIPSAFTGTIVNQWQRTLFRAEIGECNIYYIPTDPNVAAADIEKNYLDILQAVKSTVKIPVAVKVVLLHPEAWPIARSPPRMEQTESSDCLLSLVHHRLRPMKLRTHDYGSTIHRITLHGNQRIVRLIQRKHRHFRLHADLRC